MCSINNNKFTDKFNTLASIYIVRDPRNIITSLSNHYELTLEESFNFLTNKKKIIFPKNINVNKKENEDPDDFNFLSDWSSHYTSWKDIKFCPVLIIKYEDILSDTKETFISVLKFLSNFMKINLEKKKINNVISCTSFANLSKLEKTIGFTESVTSLQTNKKINFFHQGKKNDWKKLLDKKIVEKIENNFSKEMKELKYL